MTATAESEVFRILSTDSPVLTICAKRIYPDAMPEGGAYPAIVFSRADTQPLMTVHGQLVGSDVTVAIGCWAQSRTDADKLAVAAQAALQSSFVIAGRESVFDAEMGLFSSQLSVVFFETP